MILIRIIISKIRLEIIQLLLIINKDYEYRKSYLIICFLINSKYKIK